jgi:hypothetical protein
MRGNGKVPKRNLKVTQARELNNLSDEELLDCRFCDLERALDCSLIQERIDRLHDELEYRGIDFRPHSWLSEEWFSPDGVPGIAIPFYLGHRRLMRLERKQMLEVEGGARDWCMRILRHEAGHAIDTAYRLRRRRAFREVFGKVSQRYPDFYQPKPFSKNFVHHLDMWYAQSHPVEDFAETFAVWLKPQSRWRSQYKGWPALKKLEFVHELMQSLQDTRPLVSTRERVEPLRQIRKTLRQHYRQKRLHYGVDGPGFFDGDLRRLFTDDADEASALAASTFLNRARPDIRRAVARWTGEAQYTIDQVLHEMIQRCREMKLRLKTPVDEAKRDATVLVTVQTMNYLHGGHHRVAL